MQLRDFDYLRDEPSEHGSLAKLAQLIHQARADVDLCLLLDNGDTLQGTPVTDYLARLDPDQPHPMAGAMNALGYDVVGLGNHDADFGLDRLASILRQYKAEIVCSNLRAAALPMIKPGVLLHRRVARRDGGEETLCIGVVGALPQMTENWNRHHLSGRATVSPALAALSKAARDLRIRGADIVVALAHMGISLGDEGECPQNQIIDVARLPHIDAVVGGHTHLRFPGPDHQDSEEVDCTRGLIDGTPVVQPGVSGSDLGQIDLELERSGDGWRIVSRRSTLRSSLPQTLESAQILNLGTRVHDATRDYLAQEVTRIGAPMHTFFALARPCPVTALLSNVKLHALKNAIRGPSLPDLPLLAAVSAPATGGFDGPQNFLTLENGPLLRRHIAGLNRYANQIWAVRATGARLHDWLERSALIYNTLTAEQPDQALINARVPGFRFDTIYGLTYKIDPTRPAAFDVAGRRCPGQSGRVSDLRHDGLPVRPEDEFIVATTDHRVGGGGAHLPFSDPEIVLRGSVPLEEALLEYLAMTDLDALHDIRPWSFPSRPGVSALLETAPAAADHLEEIARFSPEIVDTTADGFLRLRLHL